MLDDPYVSMETDDPNNTENSGKNKKTMYIIGGVVVLLLIIVLIIVLVVVSPGNNDDNNNNSSLTATQKLNLVMTEIVNDCEERESAGGNFSCANITASQRATIQEIFSEFNEDGDDEWSMTEYTNFYMATSDDSTYFDELDVDDDGELDFVEVMASLKKQSEIVPDIFNQSYNYDVYNAYAVEYNLSDWRWFAFAADLFLQDEFSEVYGGYPNGIDKEEYLNTTCMEQFELYDDDDGDGEPDIDIDEFINKSFIGYGLTFYVEYMNTPSVWNAPAVNESVLEGIVEEINAASNVWSVGLEDELSNNTTRRRLASADCKTVQNECRGESMKQSEQLAGQDPSKGATSKTSTGYIECKNKECNACKSCFIVCKTFSSKEAYCVNWVTNNV